MKSAEHCNPDRWLDHRLVVGALAALRAESPARCVYHTADHTIDVISEAEYFAVTDQLSERQRELLAVAAAFHDLGFLDSAAPRNEDRAAARVALAMRDDGGFAPDEIRLVEEMILDTAVVVTPQGPRMTPRSALARYLLDADVSNFGRDDFFEKLELVRLESGSTNSAQFLLSVEALMLGHRWHTPAAQRSREARKQHNLAELRRRIAGASGAGG